MKIFIAIPHFFNRKGEPQDSSPRYASTILSAHQRVPVLAGCLQSFLWAFPTDNIELDNSSGVIGKTVNLHRQTDEITIALCTVEQDHLVDLLPKPLPAQVKHEIVACEPLHLGFACHRLMTEAYHSGDYDFFGYFEDDIALCTTDTFTKIAWFAERFGEECVLVPNRFEVFNNWHKVYIDGPLPDEITQLYYDHRKDKFLSADYLDGRKREFVRSSNPMAASFILTRGQMARLARDERFGRPSSGLMSYLESAQILPLLPNFKVYKPTLADASFLEVQHVGTRLTLLRTPRQVLEGFLESSAGQPAGREG